MLRGNVTSCLDYMTQHGISTFTEYYYLRGCNWDAFSCCFYKSSLDQDLCQLKVLECPNDGDLEKSPPTREFVFIVFILSLLVILNIVFGCMLLRVRQVYLA